MISNSKFGLWMKSWYRKKNTKRYGVKEILLIEVLPAGHDMDTMDRYVRLY